MNICLFVMIFNLGKMLGFFLGATFTYLQGFLQYLPGREKGKIPLQYSCFRASA